MSEAALQRSETRASFFIEIAHNSVYNSLRMAGTRYCLCCNQEVPVNTFVKDESVESTCAYCGFTVDTEKMPEAPHPSDDTFALVADDSKYTRRIIEDLIKEKGFSSRVISVENGRELISAYSNLLSEKRSVAVAIIDLNMPVMDGLTAARAMRALEVQHKVEKTPLVFFSSKKADAHLREQMEMLQRANYVNKANDPDPDKLAQRVEFLLAYLMEKYQM
jgi:CheY-like chemotaxis protein